MSCSCNHCEPVSRASRPESSGGATSRAARRATLEVRLLAARFVVSAILFGSGIVVSIAHPAVASSPWIVRSLFVLSWLVAGYRVVLNSARNVARGEVFDENFLMTVATIGAFAIGQWSEAAAVMLFYNLGEMVQESAVSRSRRSIVDLMDVRPDSARYAADGAIVHPSAVAPGSLVRVLAGEKVPLDGIVTEGSSSFDTSRLTGESVPREAVPGAEALAGFVNGSGPLVVRTTAAFAETAAAKMLDLIENAQNRKARAERLITSFARVYTPIVTLGALALAILPPVLIWFFGDAATLDPAAFKPWLSRALVFLVISCPCAFVISVPLGFFGGIGGAARRGILVKGADCMDVLARAKAVVVDKTGTLTRGTFEVVGIERAPGIGERELLGIALAAESLSNHPLAAAIRSRAVADGIAIDPALVTAYEERAGYGISLTYDGHEVLAGTRRLLEERGVSGLPPPGARAGTAVEISRDGAYAGCIELGDEPKDDAALAVKALKGLDVSDIVMLTGDAEPVARAIAGRLGIDEFRAGVLPHEKVSFFEELSSRVKAKYPKASVLFVGDGINDAPVIARSDAGLAMGAMGSDAAIEAADVVLMNDSPLLVAEAIRVARRTRRIVWQNIALSFGIKIGFLALGAFGLATLWEAVFADVGVALLATVNSLRARKRLRDFAP